MNKKRSQRQYLKSKEKLINLIYFKEQRFVYIII